MYYFYAIRSKKDGILYKGISSNPEKRLAEHNHCKTKSTRNHIPFEIVYIKCCKDRVTARNFEKYFKSDIGREKLESLINK